MGSGFALRTRRTPRNSSEETGAEILEQRDGRLGGSYGLTSRVRHTPGLVYF
jgi:hypothetical protein